MREEGQLMRSTCDTCDEFVINIAAGHTEALGIRGKQNQTSS